MRFVPSRLAGVTLRRQSVAQSGSAAGVTPWRRINSQSGSAVGDAPWRRANAESGSAAVEFVILAIPLFLPIIIYLTQFAEVSNVETKARSLVREVVRAYVASENANSAEESANLLLGYGAERLGFSENEIAGMRMTFVCSANPCLTPGGRVRGDLHFDLPITHRQVRVSAQEYVSPWQ